MQKRVAVDLMVYCLKTKETSNSRIKIIFNCCLLKEFEGTHWLYNQGFEILIIHVDQIITDDILKL